MRLRRVLIAAISFSASNASAISNATLKSNAEWRENLAWRADHTKSPRAPPDSYQFDAVFPCQKPNQADYA